MTKGKIYKEFFGNVEDIYFNLEEDPSDAAAQDKEIADKIEQLFIDASCKIENVRGT